MATSHISYQSTIVLLYPNVHWSNIGISEAWNLDWCKTREVWLLRNIIRVLISFVNLIGIKLIIMEMIMNMFIFPSCFQWLWNNAKNCYVWFLTSIEKRKLILREKKFLKKIIFSSSNFMKIYFSCPSFHWLFKSKHTLRLFFVLIKFEEKCKGKKVQMKSRRKEKIKKK